MTIHDSSVVSLVRRGLHEGQAQGAFPWGLATVAIAGDGGIDIGVRHPGKQPGHVPLSAPPRVLQPRSLRPGRYESLFPLHPNVRPGQLSWLLPKGLISWPIGPFALRGNQSQTMELTSARRGTSYGPLQKEVAEIAN